MQVTTDWGTVVSHDCRWPGLTSLLCFWHQPSLYVYRCGAVRHGQVRYHPLHSSHTHPALTFNPSCCVLIMCQMCSKQRFSQGLGCVWRCVWGAKPRTSMTIRQRMHPAHWMMMLQSLTQTTPAVPHQVGAHEGETSSVPDSFSLGVPLS